MRSLLRLSICLAAAAICLAGAASAPALAESLYWQGPDLGNWSTAANWWDPGLPPAGQTALAPPALSDDAYVDARRGTTGRALVDGNADCNRLFVGASQPGTLRLVSASNLYAYSQRVGIGAAGTIQHDDGNNAIDAFEGEGLMGGDLVVGQNAGGVGAYNLVAGNLNAAIEQIAGPGAGSAKGTFEQSGGRNRVSFWISLTSQYAESGALHVGRSAGSVGTYKLSGGELIAPFQYIGDLGTATFDHSAGTNTAPAVQVDANTTLPSLVQVSSSNGGSAQYLLRGSGVLTCDNLLLVEASSGGNAEFRQSGGSLQAASIVIGQTVANNGAFTFSGGSLSADELVIGEAGTGLMTVRSENENDSISGSRLVVRNQAGATGNLVGYGRLNFSTLVNNGSIVAHGEGQQRTLDLRSATQVLNTVDNDTAAGEPNGWYAFQGGKLMLRTIAGQGNSWFWGEDRNDQDGIPDLVNSVRLDVTSSVNPIFDIALLANDRQDLPPGTTGTILGLWDIQVSTDGQGPWVGLADLTFRYDDYAIFTNPDLVEGDLRLYHYTGGQWVDVPGVLDLQKKLIHATGISSFSPFAVGFDIHIQGSGADVPEPATMVLLAAGLAGLGAKLRRSRMP